MFKLVEIYKPPRTFSKLKLVIALTHRGKWAALHDWLNETGYGDLFDAAQNLAGKNEQTARKTASKYQFAAAPQLTFAAISAKLHSFFIRGTIPLN